MRSYIRTIRCGALVTGTIALGRSAYAQSDMDYIDSHAYWQYPRPRPAGGANWLIEQQPYDYPDRATLFRIVANGCGQAVHAE
jgi:hypothetical protein